MRSSHDYRRLVARWRKVASEAGIPLRVLARAGKHTLYFLESPALADSGGIYMSAAIHGDEPASSEALLVWAEKNARRLAKLPVLLFPVLNPHGLLNNTRTDTDGADLNRLFHLDDDPVINAIKRVVAQRQFALALMLHEDYDAEGYYAYEVKRERPFWGEALLKVAGRLIAIDLRAKIDGRTSRAGLIRRRFQKALFLKMGYPEAIWLHEGHARRSLTVESPSEFALERRVRAHCGVIEECVRLAAGSPRRPAAPGLHGPKKRASSPIDSRT